MRLLVITGRLFLAVGSLAAGLMFYLMSPEVQTFAPGYWTAVFVYIAAMQIALHLSYQQGAHLPRLLSRAGLQQLQPTSFRTSSGHAGPATVSRNPIIEVGSDHDIERDVEPTLISTLTKTGTDNRFELIVAPPGEGKTLLLYRLGFELLKRSCMVCTVSGELPEDGMDAKALRSIASQTRRLFILVDDMELQPVSGSLLGMVLGRDDGITVLGSCSQQGYDAILHGCGDSGISTRDLLSAAHLHQLRMMPRESQMLYDRAMSRHSASTQAPTLTGQMGTDDATDLLSLDIALEHGCSLTSLAVAAVDKLDEEQQAFLYGLAIASLREGGIPSSQMQALFGRDYGAQLDAVAALPLATRKEGLIWGPHSALALLLVRAQDLLDHDRRLSVAEHVIKGLIEHDQLARADAVMRVLLNADSELGRQVWKSCRELWIAAAEHATTARLIDLIVPTLCLAGDYRLAAGLCQDCIDHPVLGERASFELGRCLHQLGSYSAAADIFKGFLDHKSYGIVARLNLALSEVGQGHYEEAGILLKSLEQSNPTLPGLHHLLGYVAELRGDLSTAMEKYREARTHYWFDNIALRRLAALKITTGAGKEAIRLFEAGLQQEPDHVDYYGALAVAHHISGNSGRAAVQSSRAIHAGVEPALARKTVARGYLDYGLYEPAFAELHNCLAYRPDDIEAHVMIAECLHNQTDLHGATQAIQKALDIDPRSIVAKQHLAGYLCDLGQYDEAEALVGQILSAQAPTAGLALLAARIAANRGDMPGCARNAALALETGDESGWGWFLSARATGDAQAQYSYEKAVTLLKQTAVTASRLISASAYHALAVSRHTMGDLSEAVKAARRASNRITHEQYGGEMVLSALMLRHIPGPLFLREVARFIEKNPENS
jgi:tetratricopeptide (TPR) repeat protein